MRRTKIICTLGPSVDDEKKMERMMKTGFDVARFNFSHGSHEEHKIRMDRIKNLNKKLGKSVALLLDTQGPEIRTGRVDGKLNLKRGRQIILTPDAVMGTEEKISISYGSLAKEVVIKDKILLDDGLIELEVEEIQGKNILCKIRNNGELGSKKGVNLPKIDIKLPSISEKDKQDIIFGIENDVDFIALSFVREGKDIQTVRRLLGEKGKHIQIIAKIENATGVKNIDEIFELADGVMVARGDLGVEMPVRELPLIQKKIIQKGRQIGKPVIVATQMLDSMIRNPRPTRAEVSDIANSILDGTDAIMLSGETAGGKYPVESLRMMDEVAREAEKSIHLFEPISSKKLKKSDKVADLLAYSTVDIGRKIGAKCLLVPTNSGATPKRVARYRPDLPIIALVDNEKLKRQMGLVWGVVSLKIVADYDDSSTLIKKGEKELLANRICRRGDTIIVVAGIPVKIKGTTNMIRVHEIE